MSHVCLDSLSRAEFADCAGYVTVPLATDYTFSMDNDDGAMLFIDGHSLVNHAGALNTP